MFQMSPLKPSLLGPDIGDKGSEGGSSPSAIVMTRVTILLTVGQSHLLQAIGDKI